MIKISLNNDRISQIISPWVRATVVLALVLVPVFSWPVFAGEVTVAVAANFIKPLESLKPLYEKASGHTLVISSGSTGRLYAQIKNGAPYDVFLSADDVHPRLLEQEGHGMPGTRFTYAVGKLVLWSPNIKMAGPDTPSILKTAGFRKLAITNPKLAPYGLAAQQTLESLQLWDEIQGKMVLGENVGQTFSMVHTGNADLGFIALSQTLEIEGGIAGGRWVVPAEFHDPILQQVILLTRANNNPAAHALIRFLGGNAAREVIVEFGYGLEPVP